MGMSEQTKILYESIQHMERPKWAKWAFIADGRWYWSDTRPAYIPSESFMPSYLRIDGIYQKFENPVMIKEETYSLLEVATLAELRTKAIEEMIKTIKQPGTITMVPKGFL